MWHCTLHKLHPMCLWRRCVRARRSRGVSTALLGRADTHQVSASGACAWPPGTLHGAPALALPRAIEQLRHACCASSACSTLLLLLLLLTLLLLLVCVCAVLPRPNSNSNRNRNGRRGNISPPAWPGYNYNVITGCKRLGLVQLSALCPCKQPPALQPNRCESCHIAGKKLCKSSTTLSPDERVRLHSGATPRALQQVRHSAVGRECREGCQCSRVSEEPLFSPLLVRTRNTSLNWFTLGSQHLLFSNIFQSSSRSSRKQT